MLELELGLSIISFSSSFEEGTLIVPWSSRMARPVGVWRRGGRGFGGVWGFVALVVDLVVDKAEEGCSFIEGILGWIVCWSVGVLECEVV